MPFNDVELKKLKEAFNTWAKTTPHPRAPVITAANDKSYSARQIAKGVEKGNDIGRHVLDMVETYVSAGMKTLDEVIADITAPQAPKP